MSCLAAALLLCAAVALAQAADAAYSKSPGFAAYQQGASLFGRSKFPESLAEVDRALTLDPKLVPALTLKAKLAMAINRYDVARECLERALAVEPSSWYAEFLYGFQYYQQNEMPRALAALQKARLLNPRDPRTALYLGLAEETLGRTAEAVAFYQDAIRLEEASGKPHVDPFLSYSRLLFILGDLDGCGRLIERALQLDPASRDVHFESGRLLLKRGLAADAVTEGEAALRLHTGDVTDRQVHFLLIQAYQASGREREAAGHAEAIRAIERQEQK
ncbi:MAG TPA: tetratricopeptide repeat protein [Candidatus Acidoferrales bacterium]|nr:tetratricopeptide repeat protein [Candidatus Acidoferrales bacterium]